MNSSPASQTTRMVARVLGPFLVIACIVAVARSAEMSSLLADFAANMAWSWSAGPFVLVCGLIIIALHSNWHGPAAIAVSISGWLIALRGLLLLAFPTAFMSTARWVIETDGLWRAVCTVFGAIGVYLSFVGWMPTTHQRPVAAGEPSRSELSP